MRFYIVELYICLIVLVSTAICALLVKVYAVCHQGFGT